MVQTPAEQVTAWEAFINKDPYLRDHRGEYARRNAIFLPMVARADLSVAQDVSRNIGGNGKSLHIRLDIFNFTNLLSSDRRVSHGIVATLPLTSAGVADSRAPTHPLPDDGHSVTSR